MDFNAAAIIPARYASVRLPGKPLLLLGEVPLICRVYQAVAVTNLFQEIIVATDDIRILEAVKNVGGKGVMTSENLSSGTDRVVEAAYSIDCDIIVNVQGDEPFIGRAELKQLLEAFNDEQVEVASLMHLCEDEEELNNPNAVKVIVNNSRDALYFSRVKIPFNRDNIQGVSYYKHIGVYAFRKNILNRYPTLKSSKLEAVEKLEQLRWLENGYRIRMVETTYEGIGIDTKEDLIKAKKRFV